MNNLNGKPKKADGNAEESEDAENREF